MRFLQGLAVGALALAAPTLAATADAPLDWLTGCWRSDSADGRWTVEQWEKLADGAMSGTGSSGKGSETGNSEVMRITLDGNAAIFTASPNGAPPVDFRESQRGSQSITFENPSHDYPQRIRYWREGEALAAETSLKDGSQPMRWTYRRVVQ
jgi:hypothetical protein